MPDGEWPVLQLLGDIPVTVLSAVIAALCDGLEDRGMVAYFKSPTQEQKTGKAPGFELTGLKTVWIRHASDPGGMP
jgi:hypothetical protein